MSSTTKFYWESMIPLDDLVVSGDVKLGRGNVISKIDIRENPGPYPIYSSSAKNDGKMGEYGSYMFDDEMISWSVDGGGYFFHRPKHKFSVTNVSGYMCLNQDWDYKFTAYSLQFQHGYFSFDYQAKAHPSVIREFYFFPKVPVTEQQKIATILSSVDDVIEKTRAQIDKLKDLKTGMMQELLTKGIGHTEFKDSEVGRIPSSWEVYSLSDISEFRRGSFPQPYGNPEWYSDTGYPFVQVYDIAKNGMLKPLTKVRISEAAALKSVFVEKGSIIVSLQGSIGRVATTQYDAYVDRTILIFSNIASILDKNYFALMIGEIFREKSSEADGGVIKTITKATLKNFYLQIPPMAEQLQFSKTIGAIESKMLITTQKLEDCMALKKALMQDLLTGKVRVKLTDKESAVV